MKLKGKWRDKYYMRRKRRPAQTILVESDALHHTYSVSEPIYKTTDKVING